MNTPRKHNIPPPSVFKAYWLPDLIVTLALMLITAAIFHWTRLDRVATGWFYRPDDPWKPFSMHLHAPWIQCYEYIALPLILLAGGALVVYIAGFWKAGWRRLRRHAIFILLALALGPGVVVNGIFKEHWGRPRPKQTVVFGGDKPYRAALEPAGPGEGKSFPCGHSSVGYIFCVFYFIWRRKRKALSFAALLSAMLFGSFIGWGRLLGGAHFLSDVLWSAYLSFLPAWWLYYFVLNIPGHEEAARHETAPAIRWPAMVRITAFVALIVGGSLMATPHNKVILHGSKSLRGLSPDTTIRIEVANAHIDALFEPTRSVLVRGEVESFGWARSRIVDRFIQDLDAEPPIVHYRLDRKGLFTEYDAQLELRLPSVYPGRIEFILRDAQLHMRGNPPNADIHIRQINSSTTAPEGWKDLVRPEAP